MIISSLPIQFLLTKSSLVSMPYDASGELLSSNAIAVEQQSNNGEIVPGEVGCASGAFLENLGAEDLCLQLED